MRASGRERGEPRDVVAGTPPPAEKCGPRTPLLPLVTIFFAFDAPARYRRRVSRLDSARSRLREVHRRVLRRLRAEAPGRRLTQRQLAERVGLSREQIVALESGRSALTEGALARYLAAHGMSVGAFYRLAARVAEEVERSEGGGPAAAPPAAAPPPGLPPGAAILWQRQSGDEVLVLMQLPARGAARPR